MHHARWAYAAHLSEGDYRVLSVTVSLDFTKRTAVSILSCMLSPTSKSLGPKYPAGGSKTLEKISKRLERKLSDESHAHFNPITDARRA